MPAKINLIGKRFGRLTVIAEAKPKHKRTFWKCRRDCGSIVEINASSLVRGLSKSCGCLSIETVVNRSKTHGQTNSRLYSIWTHIKGRCYCKTNAAFASYGARGIEMDDGWRNDFTKFRDWALSNGYTSNLTIDRINNDGNYEPSNCRWADRTQQARNTRNNVMFDGKCLAEWGDITGISPALVAARVNRLGWPLEKAIFTKPRAFHKRVKESTS